MANAWLTHVKKYRKAHPNVNFKEALKQAKKMYKKGGCLKIWACLKTDGCLHVGGKVKKRKKRKKKVGAGEGAYSLQYAAIGLATVSASMTAVPLIGDIIGDAELLSDDALEAVSVIGNAFDWLWIYKVLYNLKI